MNRKQNIHRNPFLLTTFTALSFALATTTFAKDPSPGTAAPDAAAPDAAAQTSASEKTDDANAESSSPKRAKAQEKKDRKAKRAKSKWEPLTDKWVVCQFGGDGPVEMGKDLITMGFGDPFTGIRWEGDLVRENYEVELEARRTDGFDFFCALTFPVGKDHVSLVLGGWGGGVVGISSVDGRDASENDTTLFRNFDNNQWYKVRVRVDPYAIQCWIDDKLACEQERAGHEFDIRYEMDPCVPLGVANYQCTSEIKNIRRRKLTKKEISEAKKNIEEAKN